MTADLGSDLGLVAVEAMRLQNGYALAIDTRDWDLFRSLFTPDVLAQYPNTDHRGMDAWLAEFVPFHARCDWTLHVMSNHVVGRDDDGIWAACYGWVQWTHQDEPGRINRTYTLYRDRLAQDGDGTWRITRRRLDLLMPEHGVPIPEPVTLPASVATLTARC